MARYKPYRSAYRPRSLRKKHAKTQKRLIFNIILALILLYVVLGWLLPNLIGGLSFLNKYKPQSTKAPVSDNLTLAPPVLNIPYEATNSALISISGYATPDTKINIYLDDQLKSSTTTSSDGNFTTDTIPLDIGTNNIYGKSVDSSGKESLPSKTIQLTYSNDKPKLDLSSPADNTQIKGGDKKVTVSGSTDPDSNISVNSNTVIVSSDGGFSVTIPINDGDNNIVVIATNSVGNTTQVTRKVTYSQ